MLDQCLQSSTTPVYGPVWISQGESFRASGVAGKVMFKKVFLRRPHTLDFKFCVLAPNFILYLFFLISQALMVIYWLC